MCTNAKAFAIKINAEGEKTPLSGSPLSMSCDVASLCPIGTEGYAIVGIYTYMIDDLNNNSISFIKINEKLEYINQILFDGINHESAGSIINTTDNSLVIFGTSNSFELGGSKPIVIKTETDGTTEQELVKILY